MFSRGWKGIRLQGGGNTNSWYHGLHTSCRWNVMDFHSQITGMDCMHSLGFPTRIPFRGIGGTTWNCEQLSRLVRN